MRRFMLLIIGASLASSCATAPPAPPFVESVADGPEQFRWSPFRWVLGTTLSYTTQIFTEGAVGGRIESKQTSRHFTRMSTLDRTGDGLTRVRIAIDNVDAADGFFDGIGHLKKVSVLLRGADYVGGMALRTWQHSFVERLERESLKLNEPYTVEVLLSELLAPLLTPRASPEPKTILVATYTGHKLVDGVRTAEIRSALTMSPKAIYWFNLPGQAQTLEVNRMNGESIEWLDSVRGYRVLYYEILTMGTEAAGMRAFVRQITVTKLDRSASRGI